MKDLNTLLALTALGSISARVVNGGRGSAKFPPIEDNKPHQGEREKARRLKQMAKEALRND